MLKKPHANTSTKGRPLPPTNLLPSEAATTTTAEWNTKLTSCTIAQKPWAIGISLANLDLLWNIATKEPNLLWPLANLTVTMEPKGVQASAAMFLAADPGISDSTITAMFLISVDPTIMCTCLKSSDTGPMCPLISNDKTITLITSTTSTLKTENCKALPFEKP